jgi:hypothetical protein
MKTQAVQRKATVACICALAPLSVGCSVYVAWRLTNWQWLEVAGLFTILTGLLLTLVGFVFYLSARSDIRKLAKDQRREPSRRSTIGLLLLLLNFPVAATLAGQVMSQGRPSAITIENRTTTELTDVSYFWGSNTLAGEIEPVAAGATVTTKCRVPLVHFGLVRINYSIEGFDVEIRVTERKGPQPWSPITFTVEEDNAVVVADARYVEHVVTKHLGGPEAQDDKLIYDFGHWTSGSIRRVTEGMPRWWEQVDGLGYEDENVIRKASIVVEGNEVRIDCKSLSGGFLERRSFETGQLIDRSVSEPATPENRGQQPTVQ